MAALMFQYAQEARLTLDQFSLRVDDSWYPCIANVRDQTQRMSAYGSHASQ